MKFCDDTLTNKEKKKIDIFKNFTQWGFKRILIPILPKILSIQYIPISDIFVEFKAESSNGSLVMAAYLNTDA